MNSTGTVFTTCKWSIHIEALIHHIPSNRNLLIPVTIHSRHKSPDECIGYARKVIGIAISHFKPVVECIGIQFERFEVATGQQVTARKEIERISEVLKRLVG